MQLEFVGHACWLIETSGKKLIIDPWLADNPMTTKKPEDIAVDYILITHAHFDHNGDTAAIMESNKATVIATAEIAGQFGNRGHGMHIGGTFDFDFGQVRVTVAFHGAGVGGGHACGFMLTSEGKTFYHAGDTGLFTDMKLLGELADIDLAMLPIGGNFTMNLDDAVRAVEFLQPKVAVPMHYDSFPIIKADPRDFKAKVESRTKTKVIILQPGESLAL